MTDDPLYRREILRLAADATGAGHLPAPTALGSANNPACGDWVKVELALDGDRITALAHTEQACVLTQASAALLAGLAAGQNREGMAALAEAVRGFLKGGPAPGGYGVFDGAIGHAGRHRCVLLPLEAALKALEQSEEAPMAAEGQHRA